MTEYGTISVRRNGRCKYQGTCGTLECDDDDDDMMIRNKILLVLFGEQKDDKGGHFSLV